MSKGRCIFILGGHNCGKTTLARYLCQELGYSIDAILLNPTMERRLQILQSKQTRRHDTLSAQHIATHISAEAVFQWLQRTHPKSVRCSSINVTGDEYAVQQQVERILM